MSEKLIKEINNLIKYEFEEDKYGDGEVFIKLDDKIIAEFGLNYSECPEDMIWYRSIGDFVQKGIEVGIKASIKYFDIEVEK